MSNLAFMGSNNTAYSSKPLVFNLRTTQPEVISLSSNLDYLTNLNFTNNTTNFARYSGIDLPYFESRMNTETYSFFINFIGEEDIGFTQEDLEEIYYPEE